MRTRGYPRALEALYGILSADRYTTLEEILDRAEHYLPENVVAALVGEAFVRLDPTGQRVMQALAVYARPVTPAAVDFVLQPALPGLDSAPVLGRLVNMHFARREAGKYYLHPWIGRMRSSGSPRPIADRHRQPSPADAEIREADLPSSWQGRGAGGEQPYHALLRRAADYFKQARKPRADWKRLDDLAPQLAEFDLRCAAGEYDTAADVLPTLTSTTCSCGATIRLMAELHERLQGKLTDPTLKMSAWATWALATTRRGKSRKPSPATNGRWRWPARRRIVRPKARCSATWATATPTWGRPPAPSSTTSRRWPSPARSGIAEGKASRLGNLGNCYAGLGQTARAIEYYEQALAIAREIGDRRGEGLPRQPGQLLRRLGRPPPSSPTSRRWHAARSGIGPEGCPRQPGEATSAGN